MAYITLKDINKIYPNGFHAVHNFNLEIEKGEFVVFVGPSGCGKSTTLRMIAGLENISDGDFLLDGTRVNDLGPRERGIAMVFQSYALYPQMTVFDNIAFGLELQGVDEDVIEERVKKTAAILGLTDYLDRLPRALSGGQRQRVAIGRAIIRKVNIFLMDEPLSNLDAKQRVTMRSEIAQIHRETGATTIYVTHDQTEAMTLADKIVVMKNGYIQQVGTPYELYYKPANLFVAGFIGEPPMNFIRGTVSEGCLRVNRNAVLDLTPVCGDIDRWEGKEIVLGFRPEAVTLTEKQDAYRVEAKVELTELLGDNTNVYINADGTTSILKVDSHDTPEMDAPITFYIPYESVYLFDAETEKVIGEHTAQADSGLTGPETLPALPAADLAPQADVTATEQIEAMESFRHMGQKNSAATVLTDLTEAAPADLERDTAETVREAEDAVRALQDLPEEQPEPAWATDEVPGAAAAFSTMLPETVDGLGIFRRYEDLALDPASFDVASVALGQPVTFVNVGQNLFAMSDRKIVGRVVKEKEARKISEWRQEGRPVEAVITDADAADGDLKVSVALYGDLISIAEETGAEMIKLSGTKDEDVQKSIAAAQIGAACEAVFEDREDEGKESGWKLFTGDGCIGRLEAGAYKDDGRTRIAVAKVKKNVKKDKLDVWVYVI